MKGKHVTARTTALLLAICMIVGTLPAVVFAEGTAEGQTVLFADDFSGTGNFSNVTYQWTGTNYSSSTNVRTVADGYFTISNENDAASDKSAANTILTARDASEADIAAQWTDYAVEMRIRLKSGGSQQAKVYLLGRTQQAADGGYAYYAASLQGGSKTVNLYGNTVDATGKQTTNSLITGTLSEAVERDSFYTLKMVFNGNKISVYIDGAAYIDSFENDFSSAGSVGMSVVRQGEAEVDYIEVTDLDGNTMFREDFADGRYMNGSTYQWAADDSDAWTVADGVYNAAAVQPSAAAAATAKWNNKDKAGASRSANGDLAFSIASGASDTNSIATSYLALTDEEEDYTDQWTDYAIELKAKLGSDGDARFKLGLLGRLQKNQDGSLTGYEAYYRKDTKKIVLSTVTIGSDGARTAGSATSSSSALTIDPTADYFTMKLVFQGNQISVYVNGADTHAVSLEDSTYAAGGAGMLVIRAGTANIDYIKVTDLDGNPLFTDDFADDSYFSGVSGYVQDGAFTTSEPVNTVNSSMSLVSLSDGTANYAESWKSYSVEADISLTGGEAGLAARAKSGSSLQLRVSAEGAALYQVSDAGEKELASVEQTVTGTVRAKLEVRGSTVYGWLDGEKVLTCDILGAGNAAGTVGLWAAGTAQFDNVQACAIDLFEIDGTTMTLGNNLQINFFVEPTDLTEGETYYAVIAREGKESLTVRQADWKYSTTYSQYYIPCGVAAKEMTDILSVAVYNSKNEAVSQIWVDSVRDYTMRGIANEGAKEAPNVELLTLYVDMLNYGAQAQTYFVYSESDLANALLSDTQAAYATGEVTMSDNRVKGDGYSAGSLSLDYQIVLNFFFQEEIEGEYAVAAFTNHNGSEESVTIESSQFRRLENDTDWYVSVTGMAVADYAQLVTVTVYDADGKAVASASDSVESYAARANGEDALGLLAKQIVRVGTAAHNYFH